MKNYRPEWLKNFWERESSRVIASLWHFFISLSVLVALIAIVYFSWFPQALSVASGGLEGFAIVATVDMVLGPLMTLVVYNIAKPTWHLIRDVSVIVLLQLSCLFAGVWVVFQVRPIAIVHVFDTFYVLNRQSFESAGISYSALEKLSGDYPKILYVDVEKEIHKFAISKIHSELNKSTPFHFRVGSYKEMPRDWGQLSELLHSEIEKPAGHCIVQNIISSFKKGTICFNWNTFEFVGFSEGQSISKLDNISVSLKTGLEPQGATSNSPDTPKVNEDASDMPASTNPPPNNP